MLTKLEYDILQFVKDGLYGKPVSKNDIANILNERMYSRDGNQFAKINKTVDYLITRRFLERTATSNKDEVVITIKGNEALSAYNHRNDTVKMSTEKKPKFKIDLSKILKWLVGWIGVVFTSVIVELIVKLITGEWTLLINWLMELL